MTTSPELPVSRPAPLDWRRIRRLMSSVLDSVPQGRWRFVLSVVLSALASGAAIALMATSSFLLSRAAQHPPVLMLQVAIVGVRFFGISRGVFRYLERLVGHDLALRMQGSLREKVYDRLSRTTLLGKRRGDLLVRVVADVDAVLDMVVRVAVPLCAGSLVIVGTTAIFAAYNLPNALVLLATAIFAGVCMPVLARRISRRYDIEIVAARGQLGNHVHELSRTASDLTAYGLDAHAIERFIDADARLRRCERQAAWARGIAAAGQMLAQGVAIVAALVIGGQAVADGTMAPTLLAVLALTPLALHEVFANFAAAAQTLTRAGASQHRVAEVLDAPLVGSGDRADVSPSAMTGRLDVRDLAAGWPGHEPIIAQLTFSVAPGERVALVGASGIGKTTVAATIMGLIPPMAGSVTADGKVGYLAQDAHIFATTLAENVRIGDKDATDDQIAMALTRARLTLPLDRQIGEAGATLSGGEAQRVALARLLVGQHDIVILDEPTEHLDAETAADLMADLGRETRDLAVLIITHDEHVIGMCNRVVDLSPHRIH